ncbi:MAG: GspE/PulE family protein, partial [Candidatus Vogelbacteria bacterium]|nr:GspE/PulE family protein [Candidatus Vogelbacteria bacterium]
RKSSGLKILPRLTDVESIKKTLLLYQRSLKVEFGDIIQKETLALKNLTALKDGEEVSPEELQKLAEDLPVIKIVDTILAHAINQKASDIHIEPFEKEVLIRYRLDGVLYDAMVLPKETASGLVARIKVLTNLRLDEKRLPQDGRFKIENQNQNVSFRVSTLPTSFGEKIVMRLLPDATSDLTLESMGFHGADLEKIHEALKQTTGMVLVTGPTGSGKSTTVYTILNILNTPGVNISTVEDPIEYQMPRVNQTQVKPEIGLTFASGLRALVRQDPDIIMVGEIRDRETAGLAINAALTGHLVLSTLHTNSAAGTIPRLLDMGVEPFLLTSTIKVVIAQRLVRRLASEKEEYKLSPAEMADIGKHANLSAVLDLLKKEKILKLTDTWENVSFYRPKANIEEKDAYSGRICITEILTMNRALRDLITENGTSDEIEEVAKKSGLVSMVEDGIFKAAQGITSIEEVFRAVSE